MTHKERVLRHLQVFGEITTMEAFIEYSETRLSGRIFELRKEGHVISGERKNGKNKFGEPTHWTVYRMEERA